jgi:hypothetical protein
VNCGNLRFVSYRQRRANQTVVRWIMIGIGLAVSAHYFWKLYGQTVMHVGGE